MSKAPFLMFAAAGREIARGELNLERTPIGLMLMNPDYVPDLEMDATVADVRAFEIEPTGGYRGGTALTRDRDHYLRPVRWEGFTGRFRYAVWFRCDTRGLVGYVDFGPQQMTDGNVQIGEPAAYGALETVDELLASLL